MVKYFFWSIFLLLTINNYAQEALFAYINNPEGNFSKPSVVQNYKYRVAKSVFDDLVEARADFRTLRPDFVMNSGARYVAWMSPQKQHIGLEERAYDVCKSFGKDSLNAMAALIAHELIHYYEKHDWSQHFLTTNRNSSVVKAISRMEEGIKLETQADYLGGILALSADYNTYQVTSDLLGRIYDAYGLPEKIQGYPDLEERQQLSDNTAERLREMHTVFRAANLLTIIGAHLTADSYYQFILKTYQSYEIYNNAGVNSTLAALQFFEPEELPFVLPLELDLNSRLNQITTRLPDDAELERTELLEDAIYYLESAIQMAKSEPAAYLNMGIVKALQRKLYDASFWVAKSQEMSRRAEMPVQAANAQIMLGIIEVMKNNRSTAEKYFTLAMASNKALATRNMAILKEKEAPAVSGSLLENRGVETIADMQLDELLADPKIKTTVQLKKEIFCGTSQLQDSELLMHFGKGGEEYVIFHQTKTNYQGASQRGIMLGDSREKILASYHAPDQLLETEKYTIMLYENQSIIFFLNKKEKLEKWAVFQKSL